MDDKHGPFDDLESSAITVRALFAFSWILTACIPVPIVIFVADFVGGQNSQSLNVRIMQETGSLPAYNWAIIQRAGISIIFLVFGVLVLRSFAHIVSAVAQTAPKTDI